MVVQYDLLLLFISVPEILSISQPFDDAIIRNEALV
jgi:hypothetical protein